MLFLSELKNAKLILHWLQAALAGIDISLLLISRLHCLPIRWLIFSKIMLLSGDQDSVVFLNVPRLRQSVSVPLILPVILPVSPGPRWKLRMCYAMLRASTLRSVSAKLSVTQTQTFKNTGKHRHKCSQAMVRKAILPSWRTEHCKLIKESRGKSLRCQGYTLYVICLCEMYNNNI